MTDLHTIENLFNEGGESRFFEIPDYQRTYSWEKEHRADLLNDLDEILIHKTNHFTGTVVAARPNEPNGAYQIVDGQQRLTSLVLLLGRLLVRLEMLGERKAAPSLSIQAARDQYILSAERVGATRMRLTLGSGTGPLFRELCTCHQLPADSDKAQNKAEFNLLQAAKEFDIFLAEKEAGALQGLFAAIIGKMGFLFYAPSNNTEVGLMFEVINSRGKPLSELDKVKNFLIYYANRFKMSDLHRQVNDAWKEILNNLSQARLTTNEEEHTFLQSCWVPFGDARSRKSGPVYEGLKASVLANGVSSEEGYRQLSAFVRLLRDGSETFRKLYSRDAKSDPIRDSSRWLERLSFHPRLASVLPLLVALYFREGDERKRAATLELIEKLNFRYYVLGIANRSDASQSELFELAHNYFHGAADVPGDDFPTEELARQLGLFIQRNADFRRMVKNLVLEPDESWDFYGWPGLKFFLASYEQHLCEAKHQTKPLPDLLRQRDPEAYNDFHHREHIVAQNGDERIDEVSANFIRRRLGNFVLVREGTNKSVSDERAVVKIRKAYKAARLIGLYQLDELAELLSEAESFVTSERQWKKDAKGRRDELLRRFMDKREERLVAFALSRWHVPGVDPEPLSAIAVDSVTCRVPDDHLLHNRRPLLMGREALAGVLARWEKDPGCC